MSALSRKHFHFLFSLFFILLLVLLFRSSPISSLTPSEHPSTLNQPSTKTSTSDTITDHLEREQEQKEESEPEPVRHALSKPDDNPPPSLFCTSPELSPLQRHLKAAGCVHKEFLGDKEYGGWTICYPKTGLEGKTIYTIGVGRNIEWDKEVIAKYGTVHHGWDPTPTAEDFFNKKAPPAGFVFHKYGLGVKDGVTEVKLPVGHGDSWTISEYTKPAQKNKIVPIEIRRLETLLKLGGHEEIAILKIDIEGAEFEVIRDWKAKKYSPPTHQILIEFHERYFKDTNRRWKSLVADAVEEMKSIGFALVHHSSHEYTFVRSPCLDGKVES